MIKCHLGAAFAAVLAGVTISLEYFATRKFATVEGLADHVYETDHFRAFKHPRNGMNVFDTALNRFGFALAKERNGAAHVADVQRLIVLVKHQYPRTYQH